MKTTIIVGSQNDVELKEEYFYSHSGLTTKEAKELANLRPVFIRITRGVDENGKFARSIEVRTTVIGEKLGYEKITRNLLDFEQCYLEKTFEKVEDAEDWVQSQIQKVKEKRQKILENVEKNKNYESEEAFILV